MKKSFSSFVATALLLIVAVLVVSGFNYWFVNYQKNLDKYYQDSSINPVLHELTESDLLDRIASKYNCKGVGFFKYENSWYCDIQKELSENQTLFGEVRIQNSTDSDFLSFIDSHYNCEGLIYSELKGWKCKIQTELSKEALLLTDVKING